MTLGSTQPLVKMSTMGIKVAGVWGWRPHYLHVPNVMEIWEPKPLGTLWATQGLLRDSFTFTFTRLYQLEYEENRSEIFVLLACYEA
jgi:hypothetical protein